MLLRSGLAVTQAQLANSILIVASNRLGGHSLYQIGASMPSRFVPPATYAHVCPGHLPDGVSTPKTSCAVPWLCSDMLQGAATVAASVVPDLVKTAVALFDLTFRTCWSISDPIRLELSWYGPSVQARKSGPNDCHNSPSLENHVATSSFRRSKKKLRAER